MISTKYWKYRNWNIKLKLLVISAMLILCSVFLVSILSYMRYTQDFGAQSAKRIQQVIEQVSLNVDTYLDDLFRLSLSPYYSTTVMSALESNSAGSDMEKLEKSRIVEDFLDEMMIIPRKDIIRVYILADSVYSSKRTQTGIDDKTDFKSFDWYRQAMKTQDPVFVPVHVEPLDNDPDLKIFSVVRQLRSTKDTSCILGVIKVDANYNGISEICKRVDMGREGRLLITDENNNIIYPRGTGMRETSQYSQVIKGIGNGASPITKIIDSRPYIINHTKITRSNWTVIAINSLDELNQNAVATRNTAFFMAILCSLAAIVILVLYIRRFLSPLMDIVKLMKEVQNGNLDVHTKQAGVDEIGYLGTSFNHMVVNIKEMLQENTNLVKEVYEAKFLQKEAQFNALYSQIRPHFIYNTLNMISLMVQSDKPEEAVENINRLSNILRGMAIVDRETTVQNEIELLEAYLSIQKDRYAGRLAFSIDVDSALLSCEIPALLLQPIVENAVIHGCESRKAGTEIRVTGAASGRQILFSVMDNGKGMDAGALAELRRKLQEADKPGASGAGGAGADEATAAASAGGTIVSTAASADAKAETGAAGAGAGTITAAAGSSREKAHGIGLVNVNKRIKLKYGLEYGLQIDSSPGEGTIVRICLPAPEPDGGTSDV